MTNHDTSHWQRTREEWIAVLRATGIRPSRAMGQNFLVEPEIADAIVEAAGIPPGLPVLEIGPGMGMLTRALASTGAQVAAVELDRDLKAFLDRDLAGLPNVTVVEGDALQIDISSLLPDDYVLVANLPYSTGNHIVRKFLEADHAPREMTVMLQREVAERLVAVPPGMSLLTLARVIHAEATLAFHVPPDAFWPEPNVESSVVRLQVRDQPLLDSDQAAAVFRLATMAFQRKRKTISNGLSQGLGHPKQDVDRVLADAGLDPTLRPQNLSLQDWIAITDRLGQ